MRLILASASAARQRLLQEAGIEFDVVASHARELRGRGRSLRGTVLENARRKAAAVARRYPDRPVLAADTMVEFEGRLMGKPSSRPAAIDLLARMAGKSHILATGLCLRRGRRELTRCVESRVFVRELSRAQLRRLLADDDPTRFAGGYAIRPGRDPLIERVVGSFSNVIGLPLESVLPLLRVHASHPPGRVR